MQREKTLFLRLLLMASVVLLCQGEQCPDGYTEMGGMCIMMGKAAPWSVSQDTCEKAGAVMFIMKDPTQWSILKAAGPNELTTIWVGLHHDEKTDKFTWSDGSPFDQKTDWAPWGPGQPKLSNGHCVTMKRDTVDNGLMWVSSKCETPMTTVCFKVLPNTGPPLTMPTFQPISCPPGLFGFGGGCMKYSKDMVSYAEATKTCSKLKSYVLFTREKQFWDYATHYMGSQLSNFWVGLSYNRTIKQFQYSDGQIHTPGTDWAPWGPDQPGKPDEWMGDCVNTMQDFNSGEYYWIMADCDQALNGICVLDLRGAYTTITPSKPTETPTPPIMASTSMSATKIPEPTTTMSTAATSTMITTVAPVTSSSAIPTSTLILKLTTATSSLALSSPGAAASVPDGSTTSPVIPSTSFLQSTVVLGLLTRLSSSTPSALFAPSDIGSNQLIISATSLIADSSASPLGSPCLDTSVTSMPPGAEELIARFCPQSFVEKATSFGSPSTTLSAKIIAAVDSSPSLFPANAPSAFMVTTSSALSLALTNGSQPFTIAAVQGSSPAVPTTEQSQADKHAVNVATTNPTTSDPSVQISSTSRTPVTEVPVNPHPSSDTVAAKAVAVAANSAISIAGISKAEVNLVMPNMNVGFGNGTVRFSVNYGYNFTASWWNQIVDTSKWPWYVAFSIGAGAILLFLGIVGMCAIACNKKTEPNRSPVYPYYHP